MFDKRIKLYTLLSGIFLSALLLAEITGGKLIQMPFAGSLTFTVTMGVLPFPLTFVITDIINEFYGRSGIRFITFVGMGMVLLVMLLLQVEMMIPAAVSSPIDDLSFNRVFGVSVRIIIGSLTAYIVSQLVDISVFHLLRSRTGARMLWLRATGSTLVSQLLDSFLVLYIAFAGTLPVDVITGIGAANYLFKALIAILVTPLLYGLHRAI
ncbi:MAG: queuosine precursor transporter, partial [Ignavibacteria bacterium]|nr:queuosine precursor transporter [Ignavibacteria bacterium]